VSTPGEWGPRTPWGLVVGLLLGAAVAATGARLAGGSLTGWGGPFGPSLKADASPSPVAAGAVLHPAPVVVPTTGGDGGTNGEAAAAPVGRAYDTSPPPFRPTRLVLPGGHAAAVTPVGLHRDGSLVVPDNPRLVGWWTGGSMAGEAYGSIVLAGHVDSATRGVGVLAALTAIRPGQVVRLTAGRRTVKYRAASSRLVPRADLSRIGGLFARTGAARLVLITCGGAFDPVRHHYADNYVVVAVPVP
jgi:hypothetical protein